MTKFTATFASIAATLLLAGNAMAQMPAAGEGPFVEHQDYAAKRVQKTVDDAAASERKAEADATQ